MKLISAAILIGLILSSCSSNRYLLTDINEDKEFLSKKIKEYKNTEGISNKPLIVVDGKPYRYDHELKDKRLELSKSDIKKIDVLKKDVGVRIYGEFAEGGVLLITTTDYKNEEKGKSQKKENIKETTLNDIIKSGKILIIIDGNEADREAFDKINPDDIESVDVLKREAANELYPEKDLDGVIYVNTKTSFSDSNVLFLVDGKEIPKEDLEKINPNDIHTITVIKDKEEQRKYTNKEYDGVVIIIMKKQ
ncbi:hypothetical protein [Aquaticitalea lipolytica]|uniref:hypothetical protein n=1 Tax=Aquaticitalea lipolytica TaxID=1247562 RepID=UPI0024BAEB81|nr:hypothetical protein [Aquaticitalea lipolytica]